MSLTKALAAISAGSLLLIGQSAMAQEQDAYAETEVENEYATEDQWPTDSGTEMSASADVTVDEQQLDTLAQIHVEMQEETRELADELAVAASAEEAHEFQARMVERQVAVIERHGWSRDEYNAIVDKVNEDPELRASFIDLVIKRDETVASTETEDRDW